jgi:hypothetical protein
LKKIDIAIMSGLVCLGFNEKGIKMKKTNFVLMGFMMVASSAFAQEEANDTSKEYQYQDLPADPDFSELPDGVYILPPRAGKFCMVAVAGDNGGAAGRKQVNISLTCG